MKKSNLNQISLKLNEILTESEYPAITTKIVDDAILLMDKLKILFFPSVFASLESMNIESTIEDTSKLLQRICIAILGKDNTKKAEQITDDFMFALPNIAVELRNDIRAAYDGDPAASSENEIILAYPAFEAISAYRPAHILYKLGLPLLPRILTESAHKKTGIDIHPGATIGHSFFIDHGTGVVIGETCVIGDNVKLYQGVTLGAKSFEKDENGNPVKGIKRHPNIGNNVIIYAGATILGGDTFIGNNCVIGGNVWLTHSVDNDCIVYNTVSENKKIKANT